MWCWLKRALLKRALRWGEVEHWLFICRWNGGRALSSSLARRKRDLVRMSVFQDVLAFKPTDVAESEKSEKTTKFQHTCSTVFD